MVNSPALISADIRRVPREGCLPAEHRWRRCWCCRCVKSRGGEPARTRLDELSFASRGGNTGGGSRLDVLHAPHGPFAAAFTVATTERRRLVFTAIAHLHPLALHPPISSTG